MSHEETTTVAACVARSINSESFLDLTETPCTVRPDGDKVVVRFAGLLDEETAALVLDRMTSRDDAQQALRAALDASAVLAAVEPLPVDDPVRVVGEAVARLVELSKPPVVTP